MGSGRITDQKIVLSELVELVADDCAGAIATFDGRVRNHDHGNAVSSLEYSAHPAAARIVREIAESVQQKYQLHHVAIAHRVGRLEIGETALAAAVSSSHRQESFAALVALVDEVKEKLPVWKKQYFTDGTYTWSNCA
ncbi:molybdenum cofactor biosynthesis protein MoaE [Corynebacterium sp.]|uniref:molybdenum cofactor biosynthesis protein MoaE n=1 Tax=Corynebacterium sp. TaxID=1720 RepID=UPI0026DBB9F1|nr:molybdenum cofactor biosynthesis protein MoaE [Corynebacterium sp.]MDO5076578.1 molybdenum cofactor biosynthesis protein MoaE [Corynebacterium sp.]